MKISKTILPTIVLGMMFIGCNTEVSTPTAPSPSTDTQVEIQNHTGVLAKGKNCQYGKLIYGNGTTKHKAKKDWESNAKSEYGNSYGKWRKSTSQLIEKVRVGFLNYDYELSAYPCQ